jgi:thiol:disulfide interchange protein DsbD
MSIEPVFGQRSGSEAGGFGGFGGFGGGEGVEGIVKVSAQFTAPEANKPARLFVTANVKSGWHIYSITQPPGGPIATKIKLKTSDAYQVGEFRPAPPPDKKPEPAFDNLVVESHHGVVAWYAPLTLAPGVDPAKLEITGDLRVQPCDASTCLPPTELPFKAVLGSGVDLPEAGAEPPGVASTGTPPAEPSADTAAHGPPGAAHGKDGMTWTPFSMAAFTHAVGPGFDPEKTNRYLQGQHEKTSFWSAILLAFVGGVILNLMPCVLPVIGLKILSFVEQSGHNRWQALTLNVWYSLGLIAVFMVLALLAVSLNLGWGHLFKYAGFNIVMTVIVFAMALSFLGVWEIPIPGFIYSGKTAELGEREGFGGAFAKGVITTILATPCTGPFMGSALAWAVHQPPVKTFAVFFSVGLGMASPYLLIGMFPRLIRFLPKPGAWMETFKHLMGFVLLATVVYIFTFLPWPHVVPTIGMLFAAWAACWWVNRTPVTADGTATARAWLEAGIFLGIVAILLFPGVRRIVPEGTPGGLYDIMNGRFESALDRGFDERLLELNKEGYELVQTGRTAPAMSGPAGGRTVLVDFTADWCATCKVLEAANLHSAAVRDRIAQNGVVTMKADCTHEEPDVTAMLNVLGVQGVPTIAIFSADDPNKPIVFRGAYSRQDILDALDSAGPSRAK